MQFAETAADFKNAKALQLGEVERHAQVLSAAVIRFFGAVEDHQAEVVVDFTPVQSGTLSDHAQGNGVGLRIAHKSRKDFGQLQDFLVGPAVLVNAVYPDFRGIGQLLAIDAIDAYNADMAAFVEH